MGRTEAAYPPFLVGINDCIESFCYIRTTEDMCYCVYLWGEPAGLQMVIFIIDHSIMESQLAYGHKRLLSPW